MLVAPNGDILVSEIVGGRVSVLHPSPDGAARQASMSIYKDSSSPLDLRFIPMPTTRNGCTLPKRIA